VAGRLGIDHVDLILRFATDHRWEYFLRDEETLVDALVAVKLWDDARRVLAYWAMRVDDEIGPGARTCPSRRACFCRGMR
jgi:hypothetical protein